MAPFLSTGGGISINSPTNIYVSSPQATVLTWPVFDSENTGTLEVTMTGAYDSSVVGNRWSSYAVTKVQLKRWRKQNKNAFITGDGGYFVDYDTTIPWSNTAVTTTYQWQMGTAAAGGWQWIINQDGQWYSQPRPAAKDLWKMQIKKNLTPSLESRNAFLMTQNGNAAELRARMLLRDLIGDEEFRRYLVRGFIVVHGKTGIIYKVPGGHETIVSYVKDKEGTYKPFERFCIVFKSQSLPHTDSLVMRKLLLETDEFNIRKMANVSSCGETPRHRNVQLFNPIPLLKVAV